MTATISKIFSIVQNGRKRLDELKLIQVNLLDVRDEYGTTPLMVACEHSSGKSSIDTVEYLIDSGVDINCKDSYGWTALIHACYHSNGTSSVETVKYLIENGAIVDDTDSSGWTALAYACACCSNTLEKLETTKYLVEIGANINAVNNSGKTILSFVLINLRNIGVADFLIKCGAEIDASFEYKHIMFHHDMEMLKINCAINYNRGIIGTELFDII